MRKNIRENIGIQFCVEFFVKMDQGVKVVMLGRQNERNSSYVRLAHTFVFYVSLPNEIKLLLFNIFFFGSEKS